MNTTAVFSSRRFPTMIRLTSTEWQPITIIKVVSTISLLADDLQAQLTELYTARLAYIPPLTIDPIRWLCMIYDDTDNASKTIASVKLRNSDYIDCISLTYLDGMPSASRDAGKGGHVQPHFTLINGEHITEVLSCFDGEWVRGIQFVTSAGRCSAIYGIFEGIPAISRSKGGILAGFSINTKKHPTWDYLVTGVRGIWRYDALPRVPKENDVYSDYFGASTGKGFNDRALIGNSNSMYISNIEVRSGSQIDSIQFTYSDSKNGQNDKIKTTRHGGSGGTHHQFELGDGEHVVSISGRCNQQVVTQLCFGTNLGRTSEIYGMADGQEFSARAPLGENGKSLRLQYILGKRCIYALNLVLIWN
ncbi:jacalin domain protein [Rhizoctonia solani 123E]|uniref:Jacalin domain protein n=1 Tax=Rhizoctonia solani 123E TaxID=1423351 RepID=A0A074RNJ3_9AGAM|nr:jacalin domain protein [Rhizoctonia solani 123E]